MKKRIILAVSVLVLLALAGGGVYFYRLPAKMQEKEDFVAVMDRYVSNYHDLLEEGKFEDASNLLKECRAFLMKKDWTMPVVYSLIMSYSLENTLWRMRKQYEKTLDNIREMERILSRYSELIRPEAQLLELKWCIARDRCEYYVCKKEYKKAYGILQTFIEANGGEAKLNEKSPQGVMYPLCGIMAECLMELDMPDKSEPYIRQTISCSEDGTRDMHIALLRMAKLFLIKNDPVNALEYIRKAHGMYQSRRSYCYFAVAYGQLGKKEEAKKYYLLAVACKKYPRVLDKNLADLKKKLSL